MLLSILIPALESRPWERIVDELHAQASRYRGVVEILYDVDGGQVTSGVKRNRLAANSTGDYRAFVDDDDEVAPEYLDELVEGCSKGPDVVTFVMTMGKETWRLGLNVASRAAGHMPANHLCAWRKDLADRIGWCPALGYGDDQLWYKPLHAAELAVTQWHVNKILYTYLYNPKTTALQTPHKQTVAVRYAGRGLRCYRDEGGEILVEVGGIRHPYGMVTVRDGIGKVTHRRPDTLQHFYTATVD